MTGFDSVNPFTGKKNGFFPFISDIELEKKVLAGCACFDDYWKKLSINTRAEMIKPISSYLISRKLEWAGIITNEMGKPIRESISEVEKVAWMIDYHCENAAEFLKDDIIKTSYHESYVSYEPIGGILGIMPWNFPFWQVFRFAIPAMLSGNVIFLKHAPNVPLCALEIERIFSVHLKNDFIYQNLFIDTDQAAILIGYDFIQGISITGSERAGSAVGANAGRNIKKCVLELGGSDPFVIFDDADIDKATDQFVLSRMSNNGQVCIAAKRLLIHDDVYDIVIELLKDKLSGLKIGDPENEETQISCLARPDLKNFLITQVEKFVNSGSDIIFGKYDQSATVFSPMLIEIDAAKLNDLDEELFGPVALITRFKDAEDAVQLINGSRYGLAASIWTKDLHKAKSLLKDINTGTVAVNRIVASDPRMPFGGVKKSGFGREMAEAGMKEFVNAKSVMIDV
jgi:succinate-semialdehyde dehydrogenase/glutarate-semialdehyde dehydrogenase